MSSQIILLLYSNATVVLGHAFNLLPESIWKTLSSSNCLKHATLPTNPTLPLKEQRWKKTLEIQTVNPQSRNVKLGRRALVVLAGIFFHVFSVILSLAHCVIIKMLICLFLFLWRWNFIKCYENWERRVSDFKVINVWIIPWLDSLVKGAQSFSSLSCCLCDYCYTCCFSWFSLYHDIVTHYTF